MPHDKSLLQVNESFLENHRDSLVHRAAAAEMLFLLSPERKEEAIKLIEDSVNNIGPRRDCAFRRIMEWKLKSCVSVHKLLETTFHDTSAASRWGLLCAEMFPLSTYFKGVKSSDVPGSVNNQACSKEDNLDLAKNQNKIIDAFTHSVNGDIPGLKDLKISAPAESHQTC